jgi:hypothetical protein
VYNLSLKYQSSLMNPCDDETREPRCNVNNHTTRIFLLCG